MTLVWPDRFISTQEGSISPSGQVTESLGRQLNAATKVTERINSATVGPRSIMLTLLWIQGGGLQGSEYVKLMDMDA